jgi:hypothetical protein
VKSGRQKGGQELSQGVDEQVRGMLCTWTQVEHGNNLGARVDGQPQPQHLCCAAQPGSQFVEAAGAGGADVEMGPLVQRLSVLACASEPCGDGGLLVAEDSFGRRWVQPFGQCEIRTMATRHGRGFSDGTTEYRVER